MVSGAGGAVAANMNLHFGHAEMEVLLRKGYNREYTITHVGIIVLQKGVTVMSTEIKLSQSTAIRLEQARGKGMPEEDILKAIQAKDAAAFDGVAEEHYRYDTFSPMRTSMVRIWKRLCRTDIELRLIHVAAWASGWKSI